MWFIIKLSCKFSPQHKSSACIENKLLQFRETVWLAFYAFDSAGLEENPQITGRLSCRDILFLLLKPIIIGHRCFINEVSKSHKKPTDIGMRTERSNFVYKTGYLLSFYLYKFREICSYNHFDLEIFGFFNENFSTVLLIYRFVFVLVYADCRLILQTKSLWISQVYLFSFSKTKVKNTDN